MKFRGIAHDLIEYIKSEGKVSAYQKPLTERFDCKSSVISTVLKKLRNKGYISYDGDDFIVLTQKFHDESAKSYSDSFGKGSQKYLNGKSDASHRYISKGGFAFEAAKVVEGLHAENEALRSNVSRLEKENLELKGILREMADQGLQTEGALRDALSRAKPSRFVDSMF